MKIEAWCVWQSCVGKSPRLIAKFPGGKIGLKDAEKYVAEKRYCNDYEILEEGCEPENLFGDGEK